MTEHYFIEGSGKCREIKNCEYLCRNTFEKLSREDGMRQIIICISDHCACNLNKNEIED